MECGIIEADPRHTVRRMRTAMQGNAIRALVELITNSDDSYIRLEDNGTPFKGVIEVVYEKVGYRGLFAVRDHAEGMFLNDVRESFKKYGAATSGMEKGKKVRGYFGQGAKDALAGMEDGKICTFKDDQFVACRLYIEGDKPRYEISDPVTATNNLRELHGVAENGTVAYFAVDPEKAGRVPQLKSVQEELANNYLLRKIMTNPRRKVILTDKNSGENRRLRYQMPLGKEIMSEDFKISYRGYGDFPIRISLWRADTDLTQAGDDRDGGLLVVDDEDAVLGISLFKYDNEPLAARFFGEVRIGRFRELLDREEAVLSEERDGLVNRHPFCKVLISEIEERIELKVNEERLRKQKESQSQIDREESKRYRKAFDFLNEIAETEAQDVVNLGENVADQQEELPNGFCLYPSSAQITVGKRYAFELRLDTRVIHHGATVQISCTNSKIRVVTSEIKILAKDGVGILRKYVVVEGIEPNVGGMIRANHGENVTQAQVFVVPEEKELLLSEGIVFQPESVTLRPNQPRKIHLLVYVKVIEGGSQIVISSENESIHVSKNEIVVNEFDAAKHIAKYELEVWGEGAGQNGIITAECETHVALLDVRVRSKEESEDSGRKGMFSDPAFDFDPDPLYRTSYSPVTGKVMIYVNFPSVKHYLGETCQFKKTLPAQVLVADLVAERCFLEIAKKKVESAATLTPEAVPDRIQRDFYDLLRKYGRKVHEALVDRNLLEASRRV